MEAYEKEMKKFPSRKGMKSTEKRTLNGLLEVARSYPKQEWMHLPVWPKAKILMVVHQH